MLLILALVFRAILGEEDSIVNQEGLQEASASATEGRSWATTVLGIPSLQSRSVVPFA